MELGEPPAAPRAKLILQEIDRTTIQEMQAVVYKLKVSGLPKGQTFTLWGKKLNSRPVPVDKIGFYVDDAGRLVVQPPPVEFAMPSGSSINLPEKGKEFAFNAIGFAKAEPFELALIDSDRAIAAFARVIPFPIEARGEGTCRIWVELGSPGGDLFKILGEGFEAGEEIRTLSRYDSAAVEGEKTVSNDGRFSATVMPTVADKTFGSADTTVTSRFCSLTVAYEWGTAAIKAQ